MNKLEKDLINFLAEDCAKADGERETGFFICAGSMFAILENTKLTTMSGYDFVEALDATVEANRLIRKVGAND